MELSERCRARPEESGLGLGGGLPAAGGDVDGAEPRHERKDGEGGRFIVLAVQEITSWPPAEAGPDRH